MNKKLIILLSIGVAIVMLTNGCGSGGGSGRYTIPPEIPSHGVGVPPGISGPGETDPDSLLASAWEDFRYDAYSSAISKFNEILATPDISEAQKARAYNGLGWARTKSTGVESAYSDFNKAVPAAAGDLEPSTNVEARIGLASALVQRGQSSDFGRAIELLEQVDLHRIGNPIVVKNPIGVSSAETRAMLAFCYFWRGDHYNAKLQINAARTEDGSNDSSVAQIYQSLKDLGLWE